MDARGSTEAARVTRHTEHDNWSDLDEESRDFLSRTLGSTNDFGEAAEDLSSIVGLTQASNTTLGPGLDELLTTTVQAGASDLHLAARQPPHVRVQGVLRPVSGTPPLTKQDLETMLVSRLDAEQRQQLVARGDLEVALSVGRHRFRAAIFRQSDSLAAALRLIPSTTPDLDRLGLPSAFRRFAEHASGLVLVTGRTGSGKSTTLAAGIEFINATRPAHIITIEDPIEYRYTPKQAVIQQREVGTDTVSFAAALRHALRQDPDVILLGELRDLETISTALTAAETGHLVFATLHSSDATGSVTRIVDAFPEGQQPQVRAQLALSIRGCLSQQLVPDVDGRLVLVSEVMTATSGIRSMIRDQKVHQLHAALETGGAEGMHTFDQSLAAAVRSGRISLDVARSVSHRPSSLDHLLR